MSFKDLTPEEFKQAIENDANAVILDVRTEGELAEGYVPGYQQINIMDPNFTHRVMSLDKSKNYYVYCRSGGRSVSACQFMVNQGFQNVHNLLYGIQGWNSIMA
jgi:phage shock protein E